MDRRAAPRHPLTIELFVEVLHVEVGSAVGLSGEEDLGAGRVEEQELDTFSQGPGLPTAKGATHQGGNLGGRREEG